MRPPFPFILILLILLIPTCRAIDIDTLEYWTKDIWADQGRVNFNMTCEYCPPGTPFILGIEPHGERTIYMRLYRIDNQIMLLNEKIVNVTEEQKENIIWKVQPPTDYPAIYRFGFVSVEYKNNTETINEMFIQTIHVNLDIEVELKLDKEKYTVEDKPNLLIKNIGSSFTSINVSYWYERKEGDNWVPVEWDHVFTDQYIGYLDPEEDYVQTLILPSCEAGDYRVGKTLRILMTNVTEDFYAEFRYEIKQEQSFENNRNYLYMGLGGLSLLFFVIYITIKSKK